MKKLLNSKNTTKSPQICSLKVKLTMPRITPRDYSKKKLSRHGQKYAAGEIFCLLPTLPTVRDLAHFQTKKWALCPLALTSLLASPSFINLQIFLKKMNVEYWSVSLNRTILFLSSKESDATCCKSIDLDQIWTFQPIPFSI